MCDVCVPVLPDSWYITLDGTWYEGIDLNKSVYGVILHFRVFTSGHLDKYVCIICGHMDEQEKHTCMSKDMHRNLQFEYLYNKDLILIQKIESKLFYLKYSHNFNYIK